MAVRTLLRQTAAFDLKNDIIRQIRSGKLRPGDPLRSASELAKAYGIAYVTAHKAIRSLAEEGYCVRETGKGTFVSDVPARMDITAVGVPAYYQSNPFHSHMIEELTIQATVRDIKAIVGRAEDTDRFIDRLVENNVKAMIRFPGHNIGSETLDEQRTWRLLKERGIATVVLNNFWFEDGPFPNVCTDEEAGVAAMMDHLISLGHTKIFLVGETVAGARFRSIEAYRKAMLKHDLPYDPRNVVFLCPPDWPEAISPMIKRMLAESTASIVLYDLYAVGLLEELKRLGVAPGKDYSIAGFEGIPEAAACGLSTVEQPVSELVSTAFSLLGEESQREPRRVLLKPKCVFRSSTGPVPK